MIAQGDVRFTLLKTLPSFRKHPYEARNPIVHQPHTYPSQRRRWHWPFPGVEQSETTGKENPPHKDCVQIMPWRQQDSRWKENGGVLTTLKKSLPQPLYGKSPRKIGLLQGCSQWISHAYPRQEEKQIWSLFEAHIETIQQYRRKEKRVNSIKYLPKWTKSTGSTGST